MYSKDSDSQSSTTKSGINTQNIIIKDEAEQLKRTGKTVQEEIAAIKTDISTDNAESQSGKLENRFDKNVLQKELNVQVEATKGFVQTASAAGNAIANKLGEEAVAKQREAQAAQEVADRAYKANPSKENEAALNTANQNLITANNEADKWQTGGEYKRKIDGAMNAISAALGGLPAAGIATSALSPEINHQIKLATEGSPMANKVAHALWGAVEAYSANQNAAAGAGGALAGEVMADVIAKDLYGKKPNQLNREEKEVVSSVSQAAGALVGGAAANSSQGIGVGLTTAKNAVENNYLSKSDWQSYEKEVVACKNDGKCIDRVKKKFSEINQDNSLALKNACRLGGSLSECHSHTSAAKEGLSYARANIPFDVTSIWQANIMRTTKKDSEAKPTKGLIGSEAINKLESLAANEKFRAELKQDPKKLKEFITVVDQATLNVRTEKGNAYEFGALHDYPNIGSLAGYQYFGSELPLEPVHPELILIGGGMAKGATTTAKFLNSVITPSTKVTVGVNGIASAVGQYVVDGEISPKQVLWDMTEARITKDFNYKKFALWSASSGFVEGYMQNGKVDDGVDKSLSKLSTSSFGYFVGKKFEKYIDPKFNTYGDGFKTEKIGSNGMMERYVPPSVMPTGIGNAIDNISNKNFDYILENGKIYYGEGTK